MMLHQPKPLTYPTLNTIAPPFFTNFSTLQKRATLFTNFFFFQRQYFTNFSKEAISPSILIFTHELSKGKGKILTLKDVNKGKNPIKKKNTKTSLPRLPYLHSEPQELTNLILSQYTPNHQDFHNLYLN